MPPIDKVSAGSMDSVLKDVKICSVNFNGASKESIFVWKSFSICVLVYTSLVFAFKFNADIISRPSKQSTIDG